MKPKLYDAIRILLDISADFDHQNRIIPKGTEGTVVECYENPDMCAIDLAIPNERLIGGFEYENVILSPEQFVVVDRELPKVGVREV
jgi:hypothetical protein